MPSDDPLLDITEPKAPPVFLDDPLLQVVEPRSAALREPEIVPTASELDPSIIVEGTDDRADDDGDFSLVDIMDLLAENQDPLSLIDVAAAPHPEAARRKPKRLMDAVNRASAATASVGQEFQSGLRQGGTTNDFRGRLLSQALDVSGQVLSGPLEMMAGPNPAEDNLIFSAARAIREATRVPGDAETGFVEDYFVRPLLQTGAFMFGGRWAQKALEAPTKAMGWIAAWLGAGVGSQAGREDALHHGATEEQVAIAYYANTIAGASEGLPLSVMINRLDDMSGGFITKKLKGELGKAVGGGIESAIQEALQEMGQTFVENWTAKDLAGYDPTRSFSDNMLAAAGTGGSIGMLLGMVTTAIGGRRQIQREAEIKEKVLDPLGVNSLDEIAGPFSILQKRLETLETSEENIAFETALEERGDLDAGLTEEKVAEQKIMEERVGRRLPNLTIDDNTTFTVSELASSNLLNDPNYMAAVLRSTPTPEIHGETTYLEAVQNNQVVIAFSREIELTERALEETEKSIKEAEAKENLTNLEQSALDDVRLKKEGILARRDAVVSAGKDIKVLMESLRPILGRGATISVDDSSLVRGPGTMATRGEYGALHVGPDGILVNTISVRTESLARAAAAYALSSTEQNKNQLDNEKNALLATTLHEFGHAIGFNQLQGIYRKSLNGTASEEEVRLFNAVRNDYYKFIRDSLNIPVQSAQAAVKSVARYARDQLDQLGQPVAQILANVPPSSRTIDEAVSTHTVEYLFSFVEYLAEQTTKVAQEQTSLVDPETLPFFKDSWKSLSEAVEIAQERFHNQAPTLEAFIRSHGIRQQIKSLSQIVGERLNKDPIHALANDGLLSQEQADRLLGEGDVFNWFMDTGFNILQIAEMNPHIIGLQNYTEHLRQWKNEVNNNLALAEHTLTKWKNLGKKEQELLGRSLLDETVGRTFKGGWKESPVKFTNKELAEYNLSDEALLIREDIQAGFAASLREMELVLIEAKKRIFANDIIVQTREINKVKKEFQDMRSRPYFPLMRFGDYIMQVRAKGDQKIEGRDYEDGQLVDYQTFDTKTERDRANTLARKHYVPDHVTTSVSHRVLPNFSLQGMPMTLLEHMESKLTSAKHSKEVSDAIEEAMQELKNDALPFRSFRKQFQRRKRVEGYSMDAMRGYANYMTSFSNHIARVKFDHLFKEDMDNIENSIAAINRQDKGDSTKRANILNHMNGHMDYVMNPVNEFVGLRSAAFLWFLGYNVKSAFVNLTQIPLVTYPYLAARFGDAKAVAEITRAYKLATKSLATKNKPTSDMTKEEANLYGMINRGLSETWLDESLATELALAASEKNLDKTLPRKMRQKAWLKLSHYGSLPFHVAEKLNRHVTAIAAYRLSTAKGKGHMESVLEARRAVEKTQFEYARWARPRFMRGKVGGTVFVFQNYMQNALYFALGGDPGALRMVVMLFMLSGIMGIPFAENAADLIDAAVTALKRMTGMKDPHTQIRVELRALLKELDVNPDLIMHGLSSSTFGFANIGEYMGWPIPKLDLSGSLSMGRILPGTQLLQPGFPRTTESTVKGVLEFGSGAIGSAGMGILTTAMNDHPDTWKSWEKAMPAAMRQISKAGRMSVRAGEETRSGYPIAGFNMHDPQDQGELIGQALGFTPREVSVGWEKYIAQQQSILYYKTWKTSVLRQWNYARELNDTEAIKEANADIREYNKVVPYGEMRIGPDARRSSWESYIRTRQFSERQIEQSKAFRRLSSEVEAVFEEGDKTDTDE